MVLHPEVSNYMKIHPEHDPWSGRNLNQNGYVCPEVIERLIQGQIVDNQHDCQALIPHPFLSKFAQSYVLNAQWAAELDAKRRGFAYDMDIDGTEKNEQDYMKEFEVRIEGRDVEMMNGEN